MFHVIGIEVTRQAMAGNGRKMAVRLKWQKFAENSSHRFPRVVRSGHRGRKKEVRLKNGKNGRKRQKMDFCVFRVVVIEVARQAMAENGRKWSKMDFRGKMVENGFLRVSRHFPTTYSAFEQSSPNLNSGRNPWLIILLLTVIESYFHSMHNTNQTLKSILVHFHCIHACSI